MPQIIKLGFAAVVLGLLAVPAQADDNDRRCGAVAQQNWMSAADITARVAAMGIDVRDVERDDGCWEVKGRGENGQRVSLKLHPQSAEVVHRSERTRDDWDDDRDNRDDRDDWDD